MKAYKLRITYLLWGDSTDKRWIPHPTPRDEREYVKHFLVMSSACFHKIKP